MFHYGGFIRAFISSIPRKKKREENHLLCPLKSKDFGGIFIYENLRIPDIVMRRKHSHQNRPNKC